MMQHYHGNFKLPFDLNDKPAENIFDQNATNVNETSNNSDHNDEANGVELTNDHGQNNLNRQLV